MEKPTAERQRANAERMVMRTWRECGHLGANRGTAICLRCVEGLLRRERAACARTNKVCARYQLETLEDGVASVASFRALMEASRLILARNRVRK